MNRSTMLVSAASAALVAVSLALSIKFWPWLTSGESPGATIRNIALTLAGVIAIPLTLWRVAVAERQAVAAQRSLLQDRYQKGAEMLGSTLLSVRLGGIYALVNLAQQHSDLYRSEVVCLLCAFVRHPTPDENAQDSATPGRLRPRLREDVQAAVTAIAGRGDTAGLHYEGSPDQIDLRGASLQSVDLYLANLSGANLENTDMTGASLNGANLRGARMTGTCLVDAHMHEADLERARFQMADLSHAGAQRAGFSGAFIGAKMAQAALERADFSGAVFSTADLTDARLCEADLSGTRFQHSFGGGETFFTRVTQAQLDEACADPANPPDLDPAEVVDAETGGALTWRGKALSEVVYGCGPYRGPDVAYMRRVFEKDAQPS